MSIGLGIILIVIGAVFAFAVEVSIPGLDGNAFGWILILAGVLTLILSMVVANTGRKRRTVVATEHPDGTVTEQERRTETRRPGDV
jgi:membrane protein implicated in regulation of membrane protease activity